MPEDDIRYEIIKTKGGRPDYAGLLQSLKYQNALIDHLNMENDLIESAKLLRLQTKEVLDILVREVGVSQKE